MSIYQITNLIKIYPDQTTAANDNITFDVEQGEIFGLLGENGAGKSTLVKQMANLLTPTSGTIHLFDKLLNHHPLYTPSHIGYMPQDGSALNSTTLAESLYFTAHLRGLSRHDARIERDHLIDLLDIGTLRDRVITRLSGGQKRLALLATTLAASPPVIILDEPTNDLDPARRIHIWEVIRQYNRERGTTVILVTHNIIEAERVIQRIGIMRSGKLIAIGRPGMLKTELNRQLRLEIVFSPDLPPILPLENPPHEMIPGRWKLLIDPHAAPRYLEILNNTQNNDRIEDFQLSTPTLEDLYLSLIKTQSSEQPLEHA